MSAYKVSTRTIDRILTWLGTEALHSSWLTEKLARQGIYTTEDGWRNTLGKAMLDLNDDALAQRYGDAKADNRYEFSYAFGTLTQALKSLQCWLYQCHEGTVPEANLYQLFSNVIEQHLMNAIIADLPEYRRAEWG